MILSRIRRRLDRRRRRSTPAIVWVALYGNVPSDMAEVRICPRWEITDGSRAFDWGPADTLGRIDGVSVWNPRTADYVRYPSDPPVNIGRKDTITVTIGPVKFPPE